jgi:hypothetical protein
MMQLIWTLIYGELSLLQRFLNLRHEVFQILAVKYVCLHRISGVIAVIIFAAISVGGRAILLRTAGSLCPLIPPFGKSNLPKKSLTVFWQLQHLRKLPFCYRPPQFQTLTALSISAACFHRVREIIFSKSRRSVLIVPQSFLMVYL